MTEYDTLQLSSQDGGHPGAQPLPSETERGPLLVSSPISQTATFHLYPSTVKIKRPFKGETVTPPNRSGSCLSGFSEKSRSRLRFTANNATTLRECVMFTGTYHNYWPIDGREFKRQLNLFLTRLRKQYPFLDYIWIAEFQTRGAPHFHLMLNLPHSAKYHRFLAETWASIADSGNPSLLDVHLHSDSYIHWTMYSGSYLCKYLDKAHQKAIPEGFRNFGRWWGNSRGLVPDPEILTSDDIREQLPQVDEVTGESFDADPVTVLVRTVGRYHEKKNRRSWLRHTNRSTSALTGAPIFRQMLDYLRRERGAMDDIISPF